MSLKPRTTRKYYIDTKHLFKMGRVTYLYLIIMPYLSQRSQQTRDN